jgi:O-antigen ligase
MVVLSSLLGALLPGAYWEEGGKWIFLCSYGFVLTLMAHASGINTAVMRSLPVYTFSALVLLLISLWYDMLHPGTYSDLTNRAAGFPGNANFAALVSVMLCSASLTFSRQIGSVKRDAAFLVITGLHVVGTMSRSGLINYALLLSLFCYSRFIRDGIDVRGLVRFAIGSGIALYAAAMLVALSGASDTVLSAENRLSRLMRNERVDDGSAASRLAAAQDSLRLIDSSPLVGHGTGYARRMAELPHNLYLQQWVNNGLLGLLSYLFLLLAAWLTFHRRGSRQGEALIAVATVGSIFSHNVLDQRPFLILLGMLLASSTRSAIYSPARARYCRVATSAP